MGLGGTLGMYAIKSPFQFRQLLYPALVVILLILSGVAVEVGGSNPAYHELTIINPQSLDLSGYDVISIQEGEDRTIVRIRTDQSDKEFIEGLFSTLSGKADGFFMTWNFATYFGY
jgi:hypothetical protein